mmetsp:Transcript_20350/g.31084  ORF Transcript_20350/g.31084 Transcript_20350/m.31084 type:complete len:102 (+) Transcript_20350:1055-1360(+)
MVEDDHNKNESIDEKLKSMTQDFGASGRLSFAINQSVPLSFSPEPKQPSQPSQPTSPPKDEEMKEESSNDNEGGRQRNDSKVSKHGEKDAALENIAEEQSS